ncbi:MAG: hypothetical protein R2811_16735 [Flavobacteriales bacterium]
MSLLRFFRRPKRLELHALEPNETWYESAYWLTLLVKELKDERVALRAQNKALLQQVNSGQPLTVTQEEFLAMREELNELHKAKAKLDSRVTRAFQVQRSLMDEVEDLRNGIDRAA